MKKQLSKNKYSNNLNISTKIYPNDVINRGHNEKGSMKIFAENSHNHEDMDDHRKIKIRQDRLKNIKRLALMTNILGGIVSVSILINRASICIQK